MKPNKTAIIAFIERHRDTFKGEDFTIFAFLADQYLSRSRGSRENAGPKIKSDTPQAVANRERVRKFRAKRFQKENQSAKTGSNKTP